MKFKPIPLSTVRIQKGLLIRLNSLLAHPHIHISQQQTLTISISDNIKQYKKVVNVNQSESKIDNRFEVSNLF